MSTDPELLRRYADEKSELAFAALVERHLNLVYGVALRRVGGDTHLAQDVVQQVFLALAQQACALTGRDSVAGWLYTTTRNQSAQLVRGEHRRHVREIEAHSMQQTASTPPTPADWERLHPLLDGALETLNAHDREAVLLRFFENRSFAEIGATLATSEDAARVRVMRALDKLQAALVRHGITSTPAALAAVLSGTGAVAAPSGLAGTITAGVMSQAAASAAATVGIAGIFAMTKLQIGIVATVAAAGIGGSAWLGHRNDELRSALANTQEQQQKVATLRAENRRLAAEAAEVEALRRDDGELNRLADNVAQVQRARRDAAQAQQARANDAAVQAEINRMNREGQQLVDDYKALIARSNDPALTPADRARAAADAQAKLAEIQQKQREIQAYIATARAANPATASPAGTGGLALRQTNAGSAPMPDSVTLSLPHAGVESALRAMEVMSGQKIVRDPSLAGAAGTINVTLGATPKLKATEVLQRALREQANVVLEPAPDGTLLAKAGPKK